MHPRELLSSLGLALLIVSIAWTEASAQTPNLKLYSAQDGLPQSQVLALYRDDVGFLWIGTYGGLSRYDGREMRTWTVADGLPSNTVTAITEDARGRLVVGTVRGACFVDPSTARSYGPGPAGITCPTHDEKPLAEIVAFWPDHSEEGSSEVWAATKRGLVYLADRVVHVFGPEDGLPSARVQGVVFHEGKLYAGTDEGPAVYVVEGELGHFEPLDLGPEALPSIGAMASSRLGLLLAGDGRLVILDESGPRSEPLPPSLADAEVVAITPTPRAGTWIATSRGAVHWRGGKLSAAPVLDSRRGLPDDRVYSLVVDRESNVWLGTDGGLAKHISGPFTTFGVVDGVTGTLVRAAAEGPSVEDPRETVLWLGTRKGVLRRRGDRFEPLDLGNLGTPRVYALARAGDEEMWIGSSAGLARWSPDRIRQQARSDGLPHDLVLALLPQTEGPSPRHRGVWVGTEGGLVFVDDEGQIRRFDHSISRTPILSLLKGSDDALWVGFHAGGVEVLDWRHGDDGPEITGTRRRLSPAEGVTDLSIWSMDRDRSGRVWLATNGDGAIGVLLAGGKPDVQRLTVENGLVNNFVWQVKHDSEGTLWLFTNRGLDRYHPDRPSDPFEHFSLADGLPTLEGAANAALEDRRGRLWFGTSGGVVRFDPGHRRHNPLPPRALIREVSTGDGETLRPGAILDPDPGPLTVRLTALSLRHEDRVRFRYRLVGGDERWSRFSEDDTVHLVGLGAGQYRIEVEAENEFGVLSAEPAVFELTVRPGFWERTWVRVPVAVLLLALIGFVARLRVRRLEKERRRLETLVTSRTLELQRQNQSLAREIEERAKAEEEHRNLEEQLRQSEKMEAVGRLAGGVAHDFNNLLTTISGYGDLIADELGPESPLRSDVQEIQNAARQAARLTQQLLAFSRKQEIQPAALHLNAVVKESGRMLRRLIGEDIQVLIGLEADPDTVICDRGQLEQILMNLALNARDSIVDSGGEIRIHTRTEILEQELTNRFGEALPPGRYAVLEVEDSGHGMSEEVLTHIFEPFFTTKEEGKGTGLGLATVYGAIRQNRGHVTVSSSPDQGTRFTVRFPVAAPEPFQAVAGGVFRAVPEGLGYTVLVVEDEDTVRALISGILTRFGYHVLEAAHGKEAIRVSQSYEGRIHLLLTDMVMPELDGRMLAERLAPERPDMEVLFVSGYPDDYLSRRGLLPEGKSFLNKPFSSKRLTRTVREVLGRERE